MLLNQEQFNTLARLYEAETCYFSNSEQCRSVPSFWELTDKGLMNVVFILRMFVENGNMGSMAWFEVLREITGQNHVGAGANGNVEKITDAWLKWGRKQGIRL